MDLHGYRNIYDFMTRCVHGNIYEIAHVQRVLCNSLRILDGEKNADGHIVILAALLHDIGRGNPAGNHAVTGSRKAHTFLLEAGYPEHVAVHVADCILTHRYSTAESPRSNEARIVFDADKLDLLGAIGTARAIKQTVMEGEPFYTLRADGLPGSGTKGEPPSLLREYREKLKKLPDVLYTETARRIAARTRQVQDIFFASLLRETEEAYAECARMLMIYGQQTPGPNGE